MEHADLEVKAVENLVAEQRAVSHQVLGDLVLSLVGGGVGDISLG